MPTACALTDLFEECRREQGPLADGSRAMPGDGALTDLFEECQREEVLRSVGNDLGLGALAVKGLQVLRGAEGAVDGSSPPAVEALVTLVRREVRLALDRDLAECLAELGVKGAARSPRESEAADSVQLSARMPSTSGSTCSSPSRGSYPPKFFERLAADVLSAQREAVARSLETGGGTGAEAKLAEQARLLDRLQEKLAREVKRWDLVWKEEAELRAEGDQYVEGRVLSQAGQRFDAVEAQVTQMSSSLQSLARLQVELGDEAKLRQEADVRLHAFLRDFRNHVAGELEELGSGHRQLHTTVEGMHGLISTVMELVGVHGQAPLELGRPPAPAPGSPVAVPRLMEVAGRARPGAPLPGVHGQAPLELGRPPALAPGSPVTGSRLMEVAGRA